MNCTQLTISHGGYGGELYCYEHTEFEEMPTPDRAAILIIPGGGYRFTSDREGEPLALEFLNRGFNAYVIKYPCAPALHPAQLVTAAAAMNEIRKRAKTAKTDVNRVYAMGFSAGGHLCGMLANCPPDLPQVAKLDFKPNAVCLCYPVINYNYGHSGSHENLLGGAQQAENCGWLNLDTSVRPDNPPAFIWTTATDTVVPPYNSLAYAMQYNKLRLRYELHVFTDGHHGLSLADGRVSQHCPNGNNPHVAKWVDLFCEFLKSL